MPSVGQNDIVFQQVVNTPIYMHFHLDVRSSAGATPILKGAVRGIGGRFNITSSMSASFGVTMQEEKKRIAELEDKVKRQVREQVGEGGCTSCADGLIVKWTPPSPRREAMIPQVPFSYLSHLSNRTNTAYWGMVVQKLTASCAW